jgi:hypothetical protein
MTTTHLTAPCGKVYPHSTPLFADQHGDKLYIIRDSSTTEVVMIMLLNEHITNSSKQWSLYKLGSTTPIGSHQYRTELMEQFNIQLSEVRPFPPLNHRELPEEPVDADTYKDYIRDAQGLASFWHTEAREWHQLYTLQRGGDVFTALTKELAEVKAELRSLQTNH